MGIYDLDKFGELEKSCGNKYLAVKFISAAARKIGINCKEYHILESKLIQWVLTGKCPYPKSKLETRRLLDEDLDNIENILCYVEDDEVADEVRKFYSKSVRQGHLIYCNREDFNQYRISRVNILLRMIWYHTDEEENF